LPAPRIRREKKAGGLILLTNFPIVFIAFHYEAKFKRCQTVPLNTETLWRKFSDQIRGFIRSKVSSDEGAKGIEHLGIEAETKDELLELRSNIDRRQGLARNEGDTTCCYANSDKSWVSDPQDVEWEASFQTYRESEEYSGNRKLPRNHSSGGGAGCPTNN